GRLGSTELLRRQSAVGGGAVMRLITSRAIVAAAIALLPVTGTARAQVTSDAPAVRPDAIVNLASDEGAALVNGQWRYSDARIVDVDHHGPGPDLRPSGPANRTHDIMPHAGAADFDDTAWQTIPPAGLEARRSNGRLSFGWYRIAVTVPERVGGFNTAGSTVVFEVVVDDYAEVWVDGKLPIALGQTGGQFVKGFNAPNRVVIAGEAVPGQRIQIAVFGANGPLSDPPGNFVWVRSATLDFYKDTSLGLTRQTAGEIVRLDSAVHASLAEDAKVEKLAGGFQFTEGPIWHPDGYLLFSDPNANTIYRWMTDGQVSVFRTKSGYAGVDIGEYGQPGSNGLTLDRDRRLPLQQRARP